MENKEQGGDPKRPRRERRRRPRCGIGILHFEEYFPRPIAMLPVGWEDFT